MSVLSGRSIRDLHLIHPHEPRTVAFGMTYGEGPASYDIRTKNEICLVSGYTVLAVSLERFEMKWDMCAVVRDKSTLAREGVDVKNTHIDPGWVGHLTLEIGYRPLIKPVKNGDEWALPHDYPGARPQVKVIPAGSPIAQVVFERMDRSGSYAKVGGKYQNQPDVPVEAIYE